MCGIGRVCLINRKLFSLASITIFFASKRSLYVSFPGYIEMSIISQKCLPFVAVQSLAMNIQAVAPVDGNCIAIIEDQTKLMKYQGCFEEKIQEIQLNNQATSIVAVELAGRSCRAITYR